jgi:hypothetical protein
LKPVKVGKGPVGGPIAERLGTLLDVFSPWAGISLTYRQFAAELGPPVTEAAVKKWPHRKKFPADVARLIVSKARERGLSNVTLDWVLWGDGPGPKRVSKAATPARGSLEPPESARPAERGRRAAAPQEPHGRYPVRIAEALEADLSHNEFGQWSSVEVQHTVIWALKDLARRLWVMHFDMGQTFELTDEWAGKVGLPVRTAERSPDGAEADRA